MGCGLAMPSPGKTQNPSFIWTDAWIFASLNTSAAEQPGVALAELIATADYLNHAIPTLRELRSSLQTLHAHGLVEPREKKVALTPHGTTIYTKGLAKRGGLFSIVDNMLNALNSPRAKHPQPTQPATFSFITQRALTKAHTEYTSNVHTG